jgi:hypothetical protein
VTVCCTVAGVEVPVPVVLTAAVDPHPARSPTAHSAPNPERRIEANNPSVALT